VVTFTVEDVVPAADALPVVCRVEQVEPVESISLNRYRSVDQPRDVPVYGTSLALLLDAALDSDGDVSHLETGRLDQLDEARP
jgi:hypothetical protein